MVLLDDKKYSCETCIKGHRSSTCKHTDRPLFEIKKKGRPVTQCEHCRELRKSKQVHVKCLCESQETNSEQPAQGPSKKDGSKSTAKAVFPNGLPDDLEASVALQLLSEGLSESDRGEHSSAGSCSCSAGDVCHCCTPRKSAPRRRKVVHRKSDRDHREDGFSEAKSTPLSLPSSQVLARIAELRPVLPRPSNRSIQLAGPLHDPSSNVAHSHTMRHYTRDSMVSSPYSRAYGISHSQELPNDMVPTSEQDIIQIVPQTASTLSQLALSDNQSIQDLPTSIESWFSMGQSFPTTCQCGDGCTCPGCVEHNSDGTTLPSTTAFSSCANPGACSHCLDCTILSLPASIPADIPLSAYDDSQAQSIDEWIQQISTPSSFTSGRQPTLLPPDLTVTQVEPQAHWDNFSMLKSPDQVPIAAPSGCCGGRCKCPSGMCTCTGDCCGCSQGCLCDEHEHYKEPISTSSGLSFATSGERSSCCSGAHGRTARSQSFGNFNSSIPPPGPPLSRRMSSGSRSFLEVPGMSRSRSSSISSSQSVPIPAFSVDLSNMFATPRPVLARQLPSSESSSSASSTHLHLATSCCSSNPSPRPSSPDDPNEVIYATSIPDSESSSEDQQFEQYSQYDPSLEGMQLN